MSKGSADCTCCPCDATVTRQFDQTSGRYNDQSAWYSNAMQGAFVQMQNMFQAQAQNSLEKTPNTEMMNQQSLTAALSTLIAAAKA